MSDDPSHDTADRPADAVAGATTLIEALRILEEHDYGCQMIAREDGSFECAGCGTRTPANEFHVAGFHRLEGASDPDDMNLIVWGTCPCCEHGGVATIGYGPNAGEADEAVLQQLDLGEAEDGGSLDVHDVD
ncbi:MAG: hypothetical protein HKN41_07865 [Ilumatobacter sp.]|nr:hypothetical protein [Ilumatobacter sp.]